jgi:hypothetical protein
MVVFATLFLSLLHMTAINFAIHMDAINIPIISAFISYETAHTIRMILLLRE